MIKFLQIISYDIKNFIKKNYGFFLIYILILIVYFYFNADKTIEDSIYGIADDEWSFFKRAKAVQAAGPLAYIVLEAKFITITFFINASWAISSLTNLPDLFVYSILKAVVNIIGVCLSYQIFNLYFDKNISRISALICLFDPYLLNLKFVLLRDDLIYSFSFIFIYTFIYIIKFKKLNSISFLIFFYLCLQFLRPLHAFALLIFVPFSFIIFNNINIGKIRKISLSKFNFKYLPYFYSILLFLITICLADISRTYEYALFLLNNTKLNYILLAFKNFYFSPSPNNILDIINGEISSEIYLNPYWALIRFILIFSAIMFYVLIVIHKPYKLKFIINPIFILSILVTALYGLFSLGEMTLGPRQGYFSYLLILPLVVQPLYLICISIKKNKNYSI